MRVASLKNMAITVTVTVGVCIISVVKDQKLTVTEFCDVGGNNWPVGIGHPCYGCNEKGVGFTKGIFQLAGVENPTPRVEKPDVNNTEGSGATMTAIGLLGGAAAILAGVSVVTLRELSSQHKARSEAKAAEKEQHTGK